MYKFTKQSYESFTISVDFNYNLKLNEILTSCSVSGEDVNSLDVSNVILDQPSIVLSDSTVTILVRSGSVSTSPYKITFKCVTSVGHKWELDVTMIVTEV